MSPLLWDGYWGNRREPGCAPPALLRLPPQMARAWHWGSQPQRVPGIRHTPNVPCTGHRHCTHVAGSGPAVPGMLQQLKSRSRQLEKGKGTQVAAGSWGGSAAPSSEPKPAPFHAVYMPCLSLLGLRSWKGYSRAHTHIFAVHV